MIRYALACGRGHDFEGWFGSSADFDRQQEKGLVECPSCGDRQVAKTLMAPAVSTPKSADKGVNAPAVPDEPAGVKLSGLNVEQRAIIAQMRELKGRLLSQAENVGERFGEEARKIHYGEAPQRGIYGKASAEEAAELVDEGIEFLPLPDLPEDGN